jgi:hypothetical protein
MASLTHLGRNMIKRFMSILLFSTVGVVAAAPAVPSPARQATPSLPATAVLAEQGDATAMLRLGEMYWYGDGAPLDRVRGDAMFARAAAAGSKEAIAALTLSAQRRQRLAEIAWWTEGYDGADLTTGRFACVVPSIPPKSSSVREAETVDAAYEAYRVCYNRVVDNLYGVAPAARIPAQVALVMSEAEFNLASNRLEELVAAAKARGREESAQVAAARARWAADSVAFITTHALRRQQQVIDAEARSRAYAQFMQDKMRPERAPPANVSNR